MSLFQFLFGPKIDYTELVKNGAIIVDVRTPTEYSGGHVKGSINIPFQNFQDGMSKIPNNKPVITCCLSGIRSGSAKSILKSNGYTEVYNGGGWKSLSKKLKN